MAPQTLPLAVEHLSYRYRTRQEQAIRDVSFELRGGEVLLIAGASGCGKTTLIRCINGLVPRSYKGGDLSGRILLDGQVPSSLSLAQISQRVGTVLQDPDKQIVGSYVFNEVAFGLENLGIPRAELITRVESMLDFLGILHLRDHETFRLSGGEKQKVTLAGVLVMRPSILLLDEPLAQLDPQSAQDALAMIRRLANEGLAVVVIEHRVEDVLGISPEHALFMVNGEVRYFGDTMGFMQAVDYREVKLPAPLIMEQVARERGAGDPHPNPPPERERDASGADLKPSPERERDATSLHPNPPPEKDGGDPHASPHPVSEREATLVEFRGISFGYEPEHPVLHNISARVCAGDVIALLGPNGAGKSTLIKHAIGLLRPNQGQVLVGGEDTRTHSSAQLARMVGYVFQSPTQMLFAPTVTQELEFGPRNLHYPDAEIQAGTRMAAEMMNLHGLLDFSPFSLSYGQQKRVSIAAIIAMRSRILVMDEPTAGQDYKNYTSFMDSILALHNFAAVIFITHDLDLAVRHANRVWLMSAGRLAADGEPEQVLSQGDLLQQCRLVPTSLLKENLALYPKTRKFMPAEELAAFAA